jgi:hypothetical protein
MRSRILLTCLVSALFLILSGCGTTPNCPVCGTTTGGQYGVIDIIPVPEHNPTGEPGGPFNSFDISTIAPNPAVSGRYLDYVSDRIGLDMAVIDTSQNLAVNAIQGQNSVADAGNGASPCDPNIQPLVTAFGNFTRYGCRTNSFHLVSGFGASGNFGGFPGAQCCASRANGVNPMSGPDGNTTTPDGNFLFVGNGSASVVVFDLTTMNLVTNPPTQPTVIADIPTGVSADYDGPLGIAPCVASWNGGAGSAADCGDDRADEMWFDPTHQVLAVINGDPGLPFITFINMTNVVGKTGTLAQQHCLPIDNTLPYGNYPAGFATIPGGYPYQGTSSSIVAPAAGAAFNPPSCIIGQIYYDGAGGGASGGIGLNSGVPVDNVGGTFPCPDPSNPTIFSGVSGNAADSLVPGIGTTPTGVSYTIPCHHGPILSYANGTFCSQTAPTGSCSGAIAPAGLGAMTYDPVIDKWLLANENAIGTTVVGSVDVIDLQLATGNGPVVINSWPMYDCMPTSIVQGPGDNFLVGCADHDGEAFPPNEFVISDTAAGNIACVPANNGISTSPPNSSCLEITQVGGVDEIWYNPGDNRYYVAARDMPNGPVMGVIDAGSNLWLANASTNTNSHSIAVDPSTNHAFVPMQAGGICVTQSSNGCVAVMAQQ